MRPDAPAMEAVKRTAGGVRLRPATSLAAAAKKRLSPKSKTASPGAAAAAAAAAAARCHHSTRPLSAP
jgi:hypothetical protein